MAWMPIPIICGSVFGGATLSLGEKLALNSEAAPFIMKLVYGGGLGAIVFVLMVFMAGMTTGGGCLSGLQALFTADFYKKYIKKDASEKQMMSFGKKITFAAGALVIVIALLLKGHSLLMLDIFSGILFAILALLVPAVIVIIGSLFSRHSFDFKKLEKYEPDHNVNR